ncbi:MAG: DUF4162 domain-containing protein, partial [Anaerolineae bacterium]|nr:DUF4162 domain-containing protein [Anaerolineae bacterium]
ILLTTQYLEEADQLADHIAMLKAGRIIAEGTPDELKADLGSDWLDITLDVDTVLSRVKEIVSGVASGDIQVNSDISRLSVPVQERTRALITVATALSEAGIEPLDISLRRPTLDEVFIHLAETETVERALEVAS